MVVIIIDNIVVLQFGKNMSENYQYKYLIQKEHPEIKYIIIFVIFVLMALVVYKSEIWVTKKIEPQKKMTDEEIKLRDLENMRDMNGTNTLSIEKKIEVLNIKNVVPKKEERLSTEEKIKILESMK